MFTLQLFMCIYFPFTKKIHAHNSSLIWLSWSDYCQALNSWYHKFINNNKKTHPAPRITHPLPSRVSLSVSVSLQRFTSKQDVIRHYNMHKKRDNSLQHGFMRFSPLDDCSVYYHGCHLNGKSTHYHCMQVTAGWGNSTQGRWRTTVGAVSFPGWTERILEFRQPNTSLLESEGLSWGKGVTFTASLAHLWIGHLFEESVPSPHCACPAKCWEGWKEALFCF